MVKQQKNWICSVILLENFGEGILNFPPVKVGSKKRGRRDFVNIYEETSSAPRQLGDACTARNIRMKDMSTLREERMEPFEQNVLNVFCFVFSFGFLYVLDSTLLHLPHLSGSSLFVKFSLEISLCLFFQLTKL